jgi:deoxyhypusine synthase
MIADFAKQGQNAGAPPKVPGVRKEPLRSGHVDNDETAEAPEAPPGLGPVGYFLEENFKHYNAGTTVEAARAFADLINKGGKMFISLAGAMSTAELGISLAKMIRAGKIHGICCTGANLEEDLFNLVAHNSYVKVPSWRDLTPQDEQGLLDAALPRVTDVCIPEQEAMKKVEKVILSYWQKADKAGEGHFPYEYIYMMLRDGKYADQYEIDPADSWLLAASERNLPIYVPGWEDSTLGNMFASCLMKRELRRPGVIKGGVEAMINLCDWYLGNCQAPGIGFFQIGGGIAGDFPICVVPLLKVDMKLEEKVPLWSYFCQISESNASYGGYSGALPNEKITWYKLGPETPRFVIESDATIVAPLMFAYVLGL